MLPGQRLTPHDILQMARRRAWLIVAPPVVLLFAALLYSSRVPNMYQADMLIAIDPQEVPDDFVRSTVTVGTDRRMNAIAVKVTSRTNLERMIAAHDLYPEIRDAASIQDVVALMRNSISYQFEGPRDERIGPTAFHVRFMYADPIVAAEVTQELGSLFVEQNAQDRGALAEATNAFLETQLKEARDRLEEKEGKLEAFRQAHGHSLPSQTQANLQALQSKQLQVQALIESIARDRDRKQMIERLYREAAAEPAAALAAAPGGVGSGELVGSARQQLAAARARLASLEQRYTPDHPDIVRIKRQIADLEPQAAAEAKATEKQAANDTTLGQIADPARRERLRQMAVELESLDRQTAFKESEERRLRTEIAEYQQRIEAVPGVESDWAALTRDYDTQQTAYKTLLGKSENARVAAALEQQQIGEKFRIVDAAQVPVRPMPSMRSQINLAGFGVGLALGLGLSFLLEIRNSSFRSEDEILTFLNLPVLATIPFVETGAEQARRRRRTALAVALTTLCVMAMGYVTWTEKLWRSLT